MTDSSKKYSLTLEAGDFYQILNVDVFVFEKYLEFFKSVHRPFWEMKYFSVWY